MDRTFRHKILSLIKTRWSGRALSEEKIPKEDIDALLEAASFAPSCFNEQPWRFLVADDEETLGKMRGILMPGNQIWANKAPVLILITSKMTFAANGKENYYHMFDAGTAWGYLSLEAENRGLVAHAMAGFDKKAAKSVFNLPDDLTVITVVAVGKYGDASRLPPELQSREKPGTRKPLEELLIGKGE